jgi:hypothetical protein
MPGAMHNEKNQGTITEKNHGKKSRKKITEKISTNRFSYFPIIPELSLSGKKQGSKKLFRNLPLF